MYHQSTKTLITGDALTADQGQLQYPNEKYTLNMEQAKQSISRFLDYEIDKAICFHGGVCSEEVKERLSTLAAGEYSLKNRNSNKGYFLNSLLLKSKGRF